MSNGKLIKYVFWAIIAVATLLRGFDLTSRPLHNDEGVNHFFLQETARRGYYPYSHENYHGPLYFYLTFSIFNLTEDSERGLRASAGIMGILTILLLLGIRKRDGDLATILSAFAIALSPSLLYYSRYAIHETLFVFGALGLALSVLKLVDTAKGSWWYLIGASLAVLITTKETFIITLFCLIFPILYLSLSTDRLTAALCSEHGVVWPLVVRRITFLLLLAGGAAAISLVALVFIVHLLDSSRTFYAAELPLLGSGLFLFFVLLLLPSVLLHERPISKLLRNLSEYWRAHGGAMCGAAILCAVAIIACFTAGFRWGDGLREMVLAVPQWVGRNSSDTGHHKPFLYYFWVLLKTEPQLWIPLLFPIFAAALAPRAAWGFLLGAHSSSYRFYTIWYLGAFAVYSYVKYKTPWLIINMTLPGVLSLVSLGLHLFRGSLDKLKLPTALSSAVLVIIIGPFDEAIKRALSTPIFKDWAFTAAVVPLLSLIVVTLLLSFLIFLFLHLMRGGRSSKVLACSWALLIVGSLVYRSSYFCFIKSYGDGNPFSYVHTSAGMVDMVEDIVQYREKHPTARILVAVNGYWPLPFYLRREAQSLGYLATDKPDQYAKEYDIMILEKDIRWSPPVTVWAKRYYRLSDVEETYTFFKRNPAPSN